MHTAGDDFSDDEDKDKDKDLFIGPQEFVVGYCKPPEQLQSTARPICHSHAMTRTGREPATICIAAQELAALRTAPQETTARVNTVVINRPTIKLYCTKISFQMKRILSRTAIIIRKKL